MNINSVFNIINLDYLGLEEVKKYYKNNDYTSALKELRKYFFKRGSIKGFIDNEDLTKEYALMNLGYECNKSIEIADDVCNKKFLFNLKWDMERTIIPVQFNEKIDWDINPFEDYEWTYMLNRNRFFTSLAESFLFTSDVKYANNFEILINDWIDNNRLSKEKQKTSWRTIEAGIRCKNWVKALDIFLKTEYISEELLAKILISINKHMEYIMENNNGNRVLSNWVILEQQGAFAIETFFPELKVSEVYEEKTLETLEEALNLQVVEDGLHWEQSFQYHNEMLNCALETIILARKNEIEISDSILDVTKKMAYATMYIIKPNHCQSNYGDSDKEDLRNILTLSSLVFNDGKLKSKAYKNIDKDTLFIYGVKGVEEFKSIIYEEVDEESKGFKDSGLYFMRSGFGEEDSYSMFKCGFLGSGHGHSDTLHLEVSARGEDVLVDSGRYTYSPENKLRIELKRPKSHNTTTVDDLDFTVCTSSWSNNGIATPIKQQCKFTDKYDFVEGGHLGYMSLEKSVFVNRKVIYIKPNIWIINDEFHGIGEHKYKQYFNFNRDKVKLNNNKDIIYNGDKGDFVIKPLGNNYDVEIQKNYISKDYNHKYESKRAVIETKGTGDVFLQTVLMSLEKGANEYKTKYIDVYDWQGKIIDKTVASAIEIKVSEKQKYIVLLVNKEDPKGRKLYIVDGVKVYGRVAVINKSNDIKKVVLAY